MIKIKYDENENQIKGEQGVSLVFENERLRSVPSVRKEKKWI